MLPAWATVLIALGGSAIAAAAGFAGSYFTLRGARLNIEHAEREAWRTRLIEAAQNFSDDYGAGFSRLALLVETAGDPFGEAALVSEQLEADATSTAHTVTRLHLLFGNGSAADTAANATRHYARARVTLVPTRYAGGPLAGDSESQDREERLSRVNASLEAADKEYREFLNAAHEAIRPKLDSPL